MNWLSDNSLRTCAWLAGSLLLSAASTAGAIRYARRNSVLDLPGQRRSHSVPTPRGGGVGIVISVLASLIALSMADASITAAIAVLPIRFLIAIALVALIGWIDDHRPLPAWSRLLVQLLAVAIWLLPMWRALVAPAQLGATGLGTTSAETAAIATLLTVLTLWSINLHNFMDGIDGLLATQAIFVLGALAWLGLRENAALHPMQLGMWAAAIAGFLPFNFPRARVFMGDVGSGVIGLLVSAALLWQMSMPEVAAASGLIAVSAFAVDASCTLLSRMLSGRRWYKAHREHLYQWLARTGMSHAQVVAFYMAWNVLVAAPVLWWINSAAPVSLPDKTQVMPAGAAWAFAVYVAGVTLWICGKRWCAYRIRGAVMRRRVAHAHA